MVKYKGCFMGNKILMIGHFATNMSDKIILVVASNGAKVLVPMLMILSKFHQAKICYCAVGSWVDIRIKKNRILNHYCKKLNLILVETEEVEENLKTMGYSNVKKCIISKDLVMQIKNKDHINMAIFVLFQE